MDKKQTRNTLVSQQTDYVKDCKIITEGREKEKVGTNRNLNHVSTLL